MRRKDTLVTGEVYHVFGKSIAGFKIFNNEVEFARMLDALQYYRNGKPPMKFSRFIGLTEKAKTVFNQGILSSDNREDEKAVDIVAYCLMPTHFHFVLKQLKDNGISTFIGNILNSYTRYFNTKHNRKGPLWEARFKNALVDTDEQLLHLTRYIHLNPVTAYLVDKPLGWSASSYREFLSDAGEDEVKKICEYSSVLDIKPNTYRDFVEKRINYQRELKKIKDLIME